MTIKFDKYHGTGNDFIIIRDTQYTTSLNTSKIKLLCDRRFGIGADGLMLLKPHNSYDFLMEYYNADGLPGTMCGNGGRCITAFAKKMGLIDDEAKFLAIDGVHEAFIDENDLIKLKMNDVSVIKEHSSYSFIDTGSPHYIEFVDNLDEVDVYKRGRQIRYSDMFKDGTNVNFVCSNDAGISVRTYERGVEEETLSCGTGAVASAIAYYLKDKSIGNNISVKTRGGDLNVSFDEENNVFTNIYLSGAAEFVFSGTFFLD